MKRRDTTGDRSEHERDNSVNINDFKDVILAGAVVVAGAIGTYLLLPHRHGLTKPTAARWIGGVLGAIAIALALLFFTPPGTFLRTVFFYAFAILSLAGAGLTITSRDPVASALWFASVILATSGLFLLAGAQFLAAGTVIVYAGAIIVTFLFVIMLASKQGCALYDRSARSPAGATFTCFLLFFGLGVPKTDQQITTYADAFPKRVREREVAR